MEMTPFHAYCYARTLENLSDEEKLLPVYASSDIPVYPYQIAAAGFALRSPWQKGIVRRLETMPDAEAETAELRGVLAACDAVTLDAKARLLLDAPCFARKAASKALAFRGFVVLYYTKNQ